MRIALAQINTTVGDLAGNEAKILAAARRAEAEKADVVLFPELTTTGYPPRDLLLKKDFMAKNLAVLQRLAAASGETAMLVGYVGQNPHPPGRDVTNEAAAVAARAKLPPRASNRCCPPTMSLTKTVISSRRGKIRPSTIGSGESAACRFARTFGTMRISGRTGVIERDPVAKLARRRGRVHLQYFRFAVVRGQGKTCATTCWPAWPARPGAPSRFAIWWAATTNWCLTAAAWSSTRAGELVAQGKSFAEDFHCG